MAQAVASVVGGLMDIGGVWLQASEADEKRDKYLQAEQKWLPDLNNYQSQYFSDISRYLPQAQQQSDTMASSAMNQALSLREMGIPGISAGIAAALPGIYSLAGGHLDDTARREASMAGGANAAARGFGGTDNDWLTRATFGANASVKARQQGFGLLSAILGLTPNPNTPSAAALLSTGVLSPQFRANTQMNVRQQNLGIESNLLGTPDGQEIWGSNLSAAGKRLQAWGMGGGTTPSSSSSDSKDQAFSQYDSGFSSYGY